MLHPCRPYPQMGVLSVFVTHPGDTWNHHTPAQYAEPVLPVSGRRSIYAAWPPGAQCEVCGSEQAAGYAGPVHAPAGNITYPAPEIRYVCKPCARRSLNLSELELTGHACQGRCSDRVHEDAGYFGRGELDELSPAERVEYVAADYLARGWRVAEVQPAPFLPRATGDAWAVRFTPARKLW